MTEDRTVGDITDSIDMSLSKLWEMVKDRAARRDIVHGVTKSQTRLSDFTSLPISQLFISGGQSVGVSASASILPMNTQD